MTLVVRVEGPQASGKTSLLYAMLDPLHRAGLITNQSRNQRDGRLINDEHLEAVEIEITDLEILQMATGYRKDGKIAAADIIVDKKLAKASHNPAQMIGAQVIYAIKDFDFSQDFDNFTITVKVADTL